MHRRGPDQFDPVRDGFCGSLVCYADFEGLLLGAFDAFTFFGFLIAFFGDLSPMAHFLSQIEAGAIQTRDDRWNTNRQAINSLRVRFYTACVEFYDLCRI